MYVCSSSTDPVVPVQFNINLLQLLVMLAAEAEVMSKKVMPLFIVNSEPKVVTTFSQPVYSVVTR